MKDEFRAALYFESSKHSKLVGSVEEFSFDGAKLSPIVWTSQSELVSFFVDVGISRENLRKSNSEFKIGVILEPHDWAPGVGRAAYHLRRSFDLILTYDETLLSKGLPFVPYIPGGVQGHITRPFNLNEKVFQISISASKKNYLLGHRLRHQVIDTLNLRANPLFRVMGGGYEPYAEASEPFLEPMYSICIENEKSPHLVTEKVLQSFLYRCAPIYWGGNLAKLGFDSNGFFEFDTIRELSEILAGINSSHYASMCDALEFNANLAHRFLSKEVNIMRASLEALPELKQHYSDIGSFSVPYLQSPINFSPASFSPKLGFISRLRRLYAYRYRHPFVRIT